MTLNKVTLIGRLGTDPELKATKTGKNVCMLNIGTGKGEEKTEWHRVLVWDKQAETAAKYLRKGSQVYAEGKIQTRSWEDKGQKKYSTEINASVVHFLDPATNKEQSASKYDDIEF